MTNQRQEDEFNEMMQILYHEQKEALAGQPDGNEGWETDLKNGQTVWHKNQPDELTYAEHEKAKTVTIPTDADVSPLWYKPKFVDKTSHKRAPESERTRHTRILECALNTDEYLGYLKGCMLLAVVKGAPGERGFYQACYDRFVTENTP